MKKVLIYTDGACSGNPGPGGWGVVLKFGGHTKTLNGAEPETTNNRMELMAAIMGLRALREPCEVILSTDSKYVQKGISEWMHGWKKNGWRTSNKKPVKNQDLWIMLDELSQKHTIDWQWIKGHAGHLENEQADALARDAITAMI